MNVNRLVIIGNGFDLAHGLKTSFYNFLNYCTYEMLASCQALSSGKLFACKVIPDDVLFKSLYENRMNYFVSQQRQTNGMLHQTEFQFFNDIFLQLSDPQIPDLVKYNPDFNYVNFYNSNLSLNKTLRIEDELIQTKEHLIDKAKRHLSINRQGLFIGNQLFKINMRNSLSKNWGGFESDYYNALLNTANITKNDEHGYQGSVSSLNEEFEIILNSFKRYLNDTGLKKEVELNIDSAFEELKPHQISNNIFKKLSEPNNKPKPINVSNVMFLNFNYTDTIEPYLKELNQVTHTHIHGKTDNSMILGYGDDSDDYYKELEKKNDNQYLKYAKSLHYQLSSNYKNLLNFIDNDYYQVYIWGHSCATSDRVLLNTIFEHPNCIGVRPFYHGDEEKNNYFDLATNISRNFYNKKLFRELVWDESQCCSLKEKESQQDQK